MLYHVLLIRDIQALFQLIGTTNVLIVIAVFIVYQLYSPDLLPDTKFQGVVNKIENNITDIQSTLGSRLDEIEEKQIASIQIIRAIASVNNPAEEIDASVVDDYLVQNGVDKDSFLLGKQVTDGGSRFEHLSEEEVKALMKQLEQTRDNDNESE